jgi:hypothetical protein
MRDSSDAIIGRRLTLANLPGFLAKSLDVPPGHVGLVVDGKGAVRVLPPGRHTVVGLLRRLFGSVSGWRFALVSTEPVSLLVEVGHVRAGDGEWVDVTCAATVRVADPQRFYAQAMHGEAGGIVQCLSASIEPAVRQAVAGWGSDDLVRGAVSDRLANEVRRALEPAAGGPGLKLEGLRYVAVRPADEALEVALGRAELEAALAEVEMDKKMSQLETQAEWQEFVRQLEADYKLPGLAQEATAPAAAGEAVPKKTQLQKALRRYAEARESATAARVERLLGKREKRQPAIVRWWERTVPWLKVVSAVLLVAAMAIYVLLPSVSAAEKTAGWLELACAVPSAVVVFISALWLERKAARERAAEAGGARLFGLGHGDRERIDGLVRDQLTSELVTVNGTLRDARDRAYREGQREDALAIKQVEERADRLREQIAAGVSGTATYLTSARVSWEEAERMLSYDEKLLAQASDLSDVVEALRQAVLNGEPVAEPARQIEAALSDLDHRFQARARFLANQLSDQPANQPKEV